MNDIDLEVLKTFLCLTTCLVGVLTGLSMLDDINAEETDDES